MQEQEKKKVEVALDADTVDKIAFIANSLGEHSSNMIRFMGMPLIHQIIVMMVFKQVWETNIQQVMREAKISPENQMNLTVCAQKLVKAKFDFKY